MQTYINETSNPAMQPNEKKLNNLSIFSYFENMMKSNAPIINLDGPSRAFTVNGPLTTCTKSSLIKGTKSESVITQKYLDLLLRK